MIDGNENGCEGVDDGCFFSDSDEKILPENVDGLGVATASGCEGDAFVWAGFAGLIKSGGSGASSSLEALLPKSVQVPDEDDSPRENTALVADSGGSVASPGLSTLISGCFASVAGFVGSAVLKSEPGLLGAEPKMLLCGVSEVVLKSNLFGAGVVVGVVD